MLELLEQFVSGLANTGLFLFQYGVILATGYVFLWTGKKLIKGK